MKINRDFFGFSDRELRNWPQPNFEKAGAPIAEINGNRLDSKVVDRSTVQPTTTRRPTTTVRTTTRQSSTRQPWTTTGSSISDVLYVSPRGEMAYDRSSHKGNMKMDDSEVEIEQGSNSLEQESSESITYQKQLMQLEKEGVRDFVPNDDSDVNAAGLRSSSHILLLISSLLYMLLSRRRIYVWTTTALLINTHLFISFSFVFIII